MTNLRVVDPHFHLWDRASGNYRKGLRLANALAPPDPTECDYLFEHLVADAADSVDLIGAVHIEALPNDPIAEVAFVERQLNSCPFDAAIVARADLSQPDLADQLWRMQRISPRLRGIRQILNVHSNSKLAFVNREYLSDQTFAAGLQVLADRNLSFELQLYPHQMKRAFRVLASCPSLRCILNHAGMWADRTLAGWREWKLGLRQLSRLPAMHVKISGLGKFDPNWTLDSYRPIVLEVLDAFGPERTMFASNYPIERRTAEYRELWRTFETIVSDLAVEERSQLFEGNANRFYRLNAFR